MSKTLATVLMPVFNAELYIRDAIESILNQTYKDFIFLIINDGSSDKSEEIILSYKDSRIKYLKNEKNLRLVATLNKGLDIIDTKYMIRMDADDISHPQRIEKLIQFMEANPDVGVCGSYIKTFGEDNHIWKYKLTDEEIKAGILFKSSMPHATCIFRMEVLKKYQIKYQEDFIHMEDKLMWFNTFKLTKFANIPETLFYYRIHQKSVSNLYKQTKSDMLIDYYKYAFKTLGYNISAEKITSFIDLRISKKLNKNSLKLIKEFLNDLLSNNKQTKLFNEKYFKAEIDKLKRKIFYDLVKLRHFLKATKWMLNFNKIKVTDITFLLGSIIRKK
jgi:glycosyltransferase involved in cell wall biosynthesis